MIVSGGGTGGHLFPGIAVAETFLERNPDSKVLFIGTQRPTDTRVLADRSFETATITCQGLKGKSVGESLKSLFQLPFSLFEAYKLIREFKPDIVLGVGGYVTGPVLLAAKLMGVATSIQEQNSVPGLANRIVGKFVDRIFITFPGSQHYFPQQKCVESGNPVRKELLNLSRSDEKRREGVLTLVVLGGSLGAHKVNLLVVEALRAVNSRFWKTLQVIHQTGTADEEMVREKYSDLGLEVRVAAFFSDMAEVYRDADLIISRAGATSLAEMTVLKKPMILIPFPFAADDHQRKNAEFLVEGGAAKMFIQEELNPQELAAEIENLLTYNKKREEMSQAAARLAKPQAVDIIVEEIIALAGN